jgi:hypothetical protein
MVKIFHHVNNFYARGSELVEKGETIQNNS